MSAPTKIGLDYYPRDVNLLKDRKFIKAKIKYGYLSIAVYDALLEMIYGDKGYYLEYTDSARDDVAWDISERLNGKYHVDTSTVCEVIEMLVECRLFSHDHFKQGIITGKRIQETYYKCTVERKNVEVNTTIWMLSVEEMEALSSKSKILSFFVNRPINSVNRPINSVNRPINSQSKVKESKVKESKVGGEQIPPTLAEVTAYIQNINSVVDAEKFYNHYQSNGWVSNGHAVRDWKAKIRSWDLEDRQKRGKSSTQPQNKFVNYNQPTYTKDELAEIIKNKKAKEKQL